MPKNKIFSLDGLLLFILVLLYLKEIQFDSFLSCFLFYAITLLLLLLYFLVDFKYSQTKNQAKSYKILILIFLVVFLVGVSTLSHIYGRYANLSFYKFYKSENAVHDSIIQTEEALNFLSQGKNPYRENYSGTSLEKWLGGKIESFQELTINPALYHYVYLPFYLEISYPFYLLGKSLFNYYDARVLNLLSYFLAIFFLWRIPRDLDKKFLLLVLFAFNPLFVSSIFYGYNDIVMFLSLVISLYFLKKEEILFSSFFLALAMGIKQPAWFFALFYFTYLYFKKEGMRFTKIKFILKNTWPLFLTLCAIFLPFLIWDFSSFVDDTVKYLAGTASNSYPIAGIGFAHLVFQIGLVKSISAYFPFWIPQLLLGLPLLYFLIKWQRKTNTLSVSIFAATFFLLVFWYFSRYFYPYYLGTISTFLILAYFIDDEKV